MDPILHQVTYINDYLKEHSDETLSEENMNHLADIIASLDGSEQSAMHEGLSNKAVRLIYGNLEKLGLCNGAGEHITMTYFYQQIEEGVPLYEVLHEIVHVYQRYRYIALESIVVSYLKRDSFNEQECRYIESVFQDKAVRKELLNSKYRNKLKGNGVLDRGDIELLLNLESYPILEEALDRKLVQGDSLDLFLSPGIGEKNRKRRENLYRMVQAIARSASLEE